MGGLASHVRTIGDTIFSKCVWLRDLAGENPDPVSSADDLAGGSAVARYKRLMSDNKNQPSTFAEVARVCLNRRQLEPGLRALRMAVVDIWR
jgi:hypothetical protein